MAYHLLIGYPDLFQFDFPAIDQPQRGTSFFFSSFELPAHINDSEFDLTTAGSIPDREGLTETTYAIMKYKLQLFGRRTNFGSPDEQNCSGASKHR